LKQLVLVRRNKESSKQWKSVLTWSFSRGKPMFPDAMLSWCVVGCWWWSMIDEFCVGRQGIWNLMLFIFLIVARWRATTCTKRTNVWTKPVQCKFSEGQQHTKLDSCFWDWSTIDK
jgi:hypothetical protein